MSVQCGARYVFFAVRVYSFLAKKLSKTHGKTVKNVAQLDKTLFLLQFACAASWPTNLAKPKEKQQKRHNTLQNLEFLQFVCAASLLSSLTT